MKLSVISPTYNESGNVRQLIEQLGKALQGIDYEIVISDDNSPDGTWAIVEEIGRKDPRVRVLRRMENRGLGFAVIDGFNFATGDVVACIDADLQHDPAILPAMFRELQNGADLVLGSRYVAGGSIGEWNWFRRFESWTATKMAQWSVNVRICDPMSGYFMVRRADFLRVKEQLNGRGFKILLEIAARLKPRKFVEVPFTFRTRTAGESKLTGKVIYAYLAQLFRLSFLGRLLPAEFLRFAVVGGSGVAVNLAAMAVLLHVTAYRDWRASALASLVATVSNYVLNNFWTFRDRAHSGMTFVARYVYYLLASLVGLAVTTGTFAGITWLLGKAMGGETTNANLHTLVLMSCQFVAILAGTFSNYRLNRGLTWPHAEKEPAPVPAPSELGNKHGLRQEQVVLAPAPLTNAGER